MYCLQNVLKFMKFSIYRNQDFNSIFLDFYIFSAFFYPASIVMHMDFFCYEGRIDGYEYFHGLTSPNKKTLPQMWQGINYLYFRLSKFLVYLLILYVNTVFSGPDFCSTAPSTLYFVTILATKYLLLDSIALSKSTGIDKVFTFTV